jgi:hypothetical protein
VSGISPSAEVPKQIFETARSVDDLVDVTGRRAIAPFIDDPARRLHLGRPECDLGSTDPTSSIEVLIEVTTSAL